MRITGTSVQRVEDPRILTGRGRYVDDVILPGMLHAAFLRSPYRARAHHQRRHQRRRKALPGVVAVLTGADLQQMTNPMTLRRCPAQEPRLHRALATDSVRLVGDPVALVLPRAATWPRTPATSSRSTTTARRRSPPSSRRSTRADPRCSTRSGATSRSRLAHLRRRRCAFAGADRVFKETFRQHRYANVPMETRGASPLRPGHRELTYYVAAQSPHGVRFGSRALLNQPAHRVRV